jgi:hypothetical protein
LILLVVGVVLGLGARFSRRDEAAAGLSDDGGVLLAGLPFAGFGRIARQVRADLEEGEYEFFPNRRSIWVVNRTTGRMAHYTLRDDELGSVDRSRVASIDLKAFPRQDTVISMSDRNYHSILWVCNKKTGDIQMWTLSRDSELKAEPPITTSIDLMVKS